MLKKLKSLRGESMVEILLALLIVVLCVEIIQVAVVTSNKLSKKTSDGNNFSFSYVGAGSVGDVSVTWTGSSGSGSFSGSFEVPMYKNSVYYFSTPTAPTT